MYHFNKFQIETIHTYMKYYFEYSVWKVLFIFSLVYFYQNKFKIKIVKSFQSFLLKTSTQVTDFCKKIIMFK